MILCLTPCSSSVLFFVKCCACPSYLAGQLCVHATTDESALNQLFALTKSATGQRSLGMELIFFWKLQLHSSQLVNEFAVLHCTYQLLLFCQIYAGTTPIDAELHCQFPKQHCSEIRNLFSTTCNVAINPCVLYNVRLILNSVVVSALLNRLFITEDKIAFSHCVYLQSDLKCGLGCTLIYVYLLSQFS